MLNLLSNTSRVEVPFIMATIAGHTFGLYDKKTQPYGSFPQATNVQYPNFMQSLNVVKINGTVNTYTLTMQYTIRAGEDPNLLERIFSKAKKDRRIVLSYGDYSLPSFIYKEEECLISDIKSNLNVKSNTINYTISCVSQAIKTTSGKYTFPGYSSVKPSDIIMSILYDNRYGLLNVFTGMIDKEKVLQKYLIAADDRCVPLEAQHMTVLDYLNYLVKCMSDSNTTDNTIIRNNRYTLAIYDDVSGDFGGTYFKVVKISGDDNTINSQDSYEINVGFPHPTPVIDFTIDDNQTYSILYDYSGSINQSDYIYRINDAGEIEHIYSPVISTSDDLFKTTEEDKTWWTQVTQYPVNATLTVKGLLRPAILMSYIKLNVLFYGRKHLSSGYYIITKQTDTIDPSGYKTTLKLLRVKGDE